MGRGAASSRDMTGGSACEASTWRSNSVLQCKLSAGVGGGAPMRQGEGLPVVVTMGLQQGSLTQAWSYDTVVVSSIGGLTNGPTSGCTSSTVSGLGFGSLGLSGKARVGVWGGNVQGGTRNVILSPSCLLVCDIVPSAIAKQ